MSRENRHTRQALSSLDSGIYFEPLEPRLLLSGTTEGVIAESRLPDEYQTNQSVVEAQILTVADEEISTASEPLLIFEQDPSSLTAVPDDLDESSLSDGDGNQSDLLWIPSSEIPTFDVLEDASKETEIEVVSYIGDSGSVDLIEGPTSANAVYTAAITDDTQTAGESFDVSDQTGILDTTDVTAILTDPETADPDILITEGDAETENLLSGEDIPSDSDLTLPEEESEILPDSEYLTTDAVSDPSVEEVRNELVFVNDDVADYDQLTEDLLTGAPDGRDITVVTLDSEQNGIEQISSALAESENIDAVHFVSHGTDRSVKLGDTWLQDTNLDTYADEISGWGDSLTEDADLMFYGCNLAGGDRGRELLDSIAELTDADVAASTDDTGYALLGGDWDFEYQVGPIDTSVAFSIDAQQNWRHTLVTITPTLWISTLNNVTGGGSPGIDTWEDGEAIELGDPNLTLGTATDGTFSSTIDLDDFAASDARLNAIHYVTNDINVGSTANIDLLAGDVLLSTTEDETIGSTAFNDEDVFVFRPDTFGDYSSGTFFMLIDGSDIGLGGADEQLNGVTLIEQDTVVAGTTFDAGTFLLSSTDGFADIRHYDLTSVGTDTAGSSSTFLDLSDIDIDDNSVDGLDLVETDVDVGGVSLTSGQLLVYSFDDGDAGDNALAVTNYDIFVLDITSTGTTSAATATMFFDGSDVSFNTAAEELTALSLVQDLRDVPEITARETIDSDGDGQIDQIKVTTDQNLNDDFSGLTMTVSGYAVAGYSSDIANDTVFYVDLTESGSADTGATPTVAVTANTTLNKAGGSDNIATDAGAAASDTAAPVMMSRETADLDSDGFIDAIHVTFSEAIDDSTVIANDWDVAGVAGETFVWNTNGDTADDADIYLTFSDGVLDTTSIPDLTYTPDESTDADVQDLVGNELGSTESWWNDSWLNRTQITFDNSAQAEDLTNFPVLVSLTASEVDFDKIKAGGADIRFIDRTTRAELGYQIEDWDDGAETATVWVNVPQIDGSSNTDFIWMYYNNTAVSDNSGTGAWNADYEGVWHLNEATDAVNVDATGNTNDGTPQLSPAAATGKISGALDFSVADDTRVEIPFNASLDLSTGVNADWTISAWVKPNSDFTDADWPLIYGYGDYDASLGLNSDEAGTDGQIEHWQNDGTDIQSTGTTVTAGSWNHVAVVRDSTDNTKLYLNGVEVGSGANVAINDAGEVSWIGGDGVTNEDFKGLIDEVRVSSSVRSADWLAAQYASMNLSFNTYGAEQAVNTVHATVDAANDLPTVTPTVADLVYTENDGAVILDAGITVADTNDADLEGATIQITGNYANGEDTLSFVNQNGITGTWTAATGILELTGTATKAEYQTALQSITYTNSSEDPSTADRTVTFTVNDGDTDSVAGTRDVTVAAENDTPTADDAAFSVAEDASNGAVVGTVTASDPDAGDTLTYSITAGNGDGIFAINSATGQITVADNSNLNYESATSYSLTVKVADNGVGALSDTAAITVNVTNINETPAADDATVSVAENSVNGTVVGTVTTTDPDAGDTLTYSITAGNGDGIFAINSATGEITVTDNSNLNYESATSYGLTVKVEDAGGLTDTAAITVNVTNVNEDPTVSSASYSIDEHSADGSAVGAITGSDPDAGDSLTYSIIAGNDQGLFSINSATGAITVNNGIDLDFEISPTHTLTIRVTDSGSPALSETATVTINLNDIFEAVAEEADPEPDPEEPEEAEPEDTASDTEPEPVEDTGTTNDQTEGDLSGSVIDDEDPTDNDTDQEDDTETEEETDSENQTEGLPQNLPSDSRDGSNAVTRKKHNPDKREGKAKTSVKNRKESKPAAESNMEEMLLINPQGKPESRREMALSKDAAEFSTIGSEEKISAPAKAIITNRTMQRELDSINEQIDEAAKRLEGRAKLIAGTAMGVSAALMGGYALWAFRGISLMASSFASLPVWQFFDPLPILSDWEGNSQTAKVGGKNDEDIIDEDEKKLRTIFNKA